MKNNQPARENRLRLVHEALFSLNIGLMTRWVMAQANYYLAELKIQLWVNRHLHLHPHSNVGGYGAFLTLALAMAFSIFLLLRLASHTLLAKELLRSAAGIVSLLTLPASWLYVTRLYPQPPGLPYAPRVWLLVELAGAVAGAAVYLYAKWFSAWLNVGLLVLHFGFWGWLFLGGLYFWLAPFQLVFPLAGLCSSLAWGLYVSRQRAESRLTVPASQ